MVEVITLGCRINAYESEVLKEKLSGLKDVIVVNTCAVTGEAERQCRQVIRKLRRDHPQARIIVTGCAAQVAPKRYGAMPEVDLVLGNREKAEIEKYIGGEIAEKTIVGDIFDYDGYDRYLITGFEGRERAFVQIQQGCDHRCTYCIVPYTRGKERSRLMDDIIEEVKGLKADGYQEITLLGQNVNSYGKDLEEDYDFATLLEEVAKTGIARIRFTTSHPWDFSREMIEIINQYDNIMPYIHLPVQSGNTEILKLMGRRYTREQYLELFHMIKEVMPDCSITTDIIVGFPNETEEQFQDTLSLYEECEYDLAYTFIYSPREGTPAAKMQDNVPFEQKQDRLERLNEVVKEKALKQNQRFLNQVVDVLVDGPSKRDETMMTGYTAHQKLINFKGRKEDIGKIVPVKVTEVKTWALKGEQVD